MNAMNNILPALQKRLIVFKATYFMKITGRLLICLIALLSVMQSQSQQAKGPVQLADQYYAAGEYYTAANLYEQFLHPSKKQKTTSEFPLNIKAKRSVVSAAPNVSRTDILFKQAESYRLANYWQEAAVSYKQCIEKDPSEYSNALYWYAVCERSLGHYDSAWESVKQYLSLTNGRGQYKEAAEKELKTLEFIHQQLTRPDSVLVKTQKLNVPGSTEKGAFALAHVGGNQFLITSTQADSIQVNGVNPNHSRLFSATLISGGFDQMTPLTLSTTDQMINQGAATVSPDGKYLYFSQWKKENGKITSSIYYSIKEGPHWSSPIRLPVVNINTYSSKQPFCTTDGNYLFFSSDRPGGSGKFDIWYAPLKKDGTAGQPVNLGPSVNTTDDEQAPFYQASSGTLVFSSNGYQGMGGYDLFAAKGNETTWTPPGNLGYPVNSSRDDIYFFAAEKTNLLSNAIVSSDRGAGCCLETYVITKAPKNKRLTGSLFDCTGNAPLADADVILKDSYGKTWKTTTNANGKYSFEIGNEDHEPLTLSVSKELYLDTSSSFKVENTDESDLLTDKLTNADLCLEKKPEPKPEPVLVIKAEDVVTVYFDFDKSLLKPGAIQKLDSIYNIMMELPVTTIQISGYTDGLGTDAYNAVLSDKRAKACADYLIQKGIDAKRVSFVSFGACCPVEMEKINGRDNPDGRSRNRRALINVKKD
jgi:outer membrane protein OmpA-like peptidoglycan-associated protein/tetratricopeptide (TPR) repeat protein